MRIGDMVANRSRNGLNRYGRVTGFEGTPDFYNGVNVETKNGKELWREEDCVLIRSN